MYADEWKKISFDFVVNETLRTEIKKNDVGGCKRNERGGMTQLESRDFEIKRN